MVNPGAAEKVNQRSKIWNPNSNAVCSFGVKVMIKGFKKYTDNNETDHFLI